MNHRPPSPTPRPLPWLMALVPIVMAVVMTLWLGRTYYLLFAAMSPIMLVGNYTMERLAVLFGQVGDAAGWCLAVDAGVGSVVVVPVQPVGKRGLAFAV